MKIFNFLLPMCFFFLSVFPCTDAMAMDNCKESIHLHANSDQDHQETDNCSPLCFCACCGGMTIGNEVSLKINLLSFSSPEIIYDQQFPKEISFSIWQPPKV